MPKAAPEPNMAARLGRIYRDPIWIDAILPTAALRVVLLVAGVLAVVVFRPEALPGSSVLDVWNRWDVPHFLEIARSGYGAPTDPARIVLLPLFPALIAIGSIVVNPLAAGMIVSFLATLGAAAGLYRLVQLDESPPTARGAVLAMNVFPTAFALVAAYSEAPFLALVVWALVAGRRGDWRNAGLLTLLAGATRLQGALLIPALAFQYLVARRRVGPDLAWLLLGLGGPAIYLGINEQIFGDPFRFLEVQRTIFGVQAAWPWTTIPSLIGGILRGRPSEFWTTVYLMPVLADALLALVTIWAVLHRPFQPGLAALSFLNLVGFLVLSWPISVPRYLMGVPGVFVCLSVIGQRPVVAQTLLVGSVLLLGTFLTLFVIGHWAF
jgi:Gpi18-like mannosyltransferase